jgi:glucose-1-phosphate cytidylyltransferase
MRTYAAQGHNEFVLALGWRKEVIQDYFDQKSLGWDIQLVDTGLDTDTGGRIQKCAPLLGDTFFATYADGLSDVDLSSLLAFHRSHAGLATLTSVPLVSQYGTLQFDNDGRVHSFREKPVLRDHWINAGFMVFDKEVFNHWHGNSLEREVLPSLLDSGHLYTYRHDGIFKSMDTYKDQQEIEQLYQDGKIRWLAEHRQKQEQQQQQRGRLPAMAEV